MGPIYLSHAAHAQQGTNVVRSKLCSRHKRSRGDGGRLQEAGGRFALRRKKRFDFAPKIRICDTGAVEKRRTLFWRYFECVTKYISNLLPALRGHGCQALLISRCSQIRADVQCRFTVAGDTPKTSAVSSIDNPPKKRNSTIWLCWVSRRASSL